MHGATGIPAGVDGLELDHSVRGGDLAAAEKRLARGVHISPLTLTSVAGIDAGGIRMPDVHQGVLDRATRAGFNDLKGNL